MRIFLTLLLGLCALDAYSQDYGKVRRDSTVNVADSLGLNEATVVALSPIAKGTLFRYDAAQAANTISVLGEPDVLRHISSFPGVSTGVEGTLGLFVRGGDCASNGVFYDDVPVYATSHVMGFVSVFPPEMVDNVTFYQGGIPASKGNMSSSLLDVGLKKRYGEPYIGKFYVSPYMIGIYNSIPVVRDRATLQVSGRTTVIPYVLNWMNNTESDMRIDVYDINAKLDVRISNSNTLDMMLFHTNDLYKYTDFEQNVSLQQWHETIFKIGWNSQLNDLLSLHTSAYYNKMLSRQSNEEQSISSRCWMSTLGYETTISEYCANTRLTWSPTENLYCNFGASYQKQKYFLFREKRMKDFDDLFSRNNYDNSMLTAFAELSYSLDNLADVRVGVRNVNQRSGGDSFSYPDVHVLNHWYIRRNLGIELTYDYLHQHYHVLEGLPTGWSLNIKVPSDKKYDAESTSQYYGGFFWRKSFGAVETNLTIGGYYRKMDGLLSYVDGKNAFGFYTDSWQQEVDRGRGTSYGVECALSAKSKRLMSSLSYTWSKTDRTCPNINNGVTFPFKFDRRHILNYQGSYMFAKKQRDAKTVTHSLGCAVTYTSGNRLTLPVGTYKGYSPPYWEQAGTGWIRPDEFYGNIYNRQVMSDKNAISTKPYFRTDVSYTMTRKSKKYTKELAFSIFNVFNVHNPYTIFREDGKWKQLSLIPIMPSVRWSISWGNKD